MAELTPYRQIINLYVINDDDNNRVLLTRTIKNKHGLQDSANVGYMDKKAWEDFVKKEYVRINNVNKTLYEMFAKEDAN